MGRGHSRGHTHPALGSLHHGQAVLPGHHNPSVALQGADQDCHQAANREHTWASPASPSPPARALQAVLAPLPGPGAAAAALPGHSWEQQEQEAGNGILSVG